VRRIDRASSQARLGAAAPGGTKVLFTRKPRRSWNARTLQFVDGHHRDHAADRHAGCLRTADCTGNRGSCEANERRATLLEMTERPLAADTSPVAERMQFEFWGQMTPARKFALFLDLQDTVIALAESGIRLRHPDASPREVFLRRAARTLDHETMLRVYGEDPARNE